MTIAFSAEDVVRAGERLSGIATRSPLLQSSGLDEETGLRAWFKAESMQRTNSFKFRGAYHHVMRLTPAQRARGIVGASSGNHAQAMSLVGRIFEIPTTVVLPDDCPELKIRRVLGLGADIVRYRRESEDRDEIVARISRETGARNVPSSDDFDVMAGNGTVALEMLETLPHLDTLLVPLGGGGLAAGCATIVKHLNSRARVFGVEPVGASDTYQSIQADTRVRLTHATSRADGLRHLTPSRRPFGVNRRLLDGVILVRDDHLATAMRLAFEHLKVVLEPSGACAMAGLLVGAPELSSSHRIGVVLSGGNVDWDTYTDLARPSDELGRTPQLRNPQAPAAALADLRVASL